MIDVITYPCHVNQMGPSNLFIQILQDCFVGTYRIIAHVKVKYLILKMWVNTVIIQTSQNSTRREL